MDNSDKADDTAARLVQAYGLIGEVAILVRTIGDRDVRVIAPDTKKAGLAAMLRMAADSLDIPKDRALQ